MAGLGLNVVTRGIRYQLSDVEQMSTSDLQSLMETQRDRIVVLDTRSEEEYRVSHVKGAIRIDPNVRSWRDVCALVPNIEDKDKIVAYCSVGYRSSVVVARLQRHMQGSDNVPQMFNLEGSLFKWANEERPMVNSHDDPTLYCHPYNAMWGMMLNSQLRRREPEAKRTSNI
ncbi:uncharacterized protein LOC134178480 [Corticium candelabrum]|uniref:uncharacterized protein LOC134178480 n=1 Tax=Corticium candelabrum TaxID=121492 RepID=UPI002E26A631|nr:uncharacterized protein LOC134178480 [Corticium candelabrum]